MTDATYFFPADLAGGANAKLRVPLANWENGANPNAGNNSGIGINVGGGALPVVSGRNSEGYNWTLRQQMLWIFNPLLLTPRVPQGACCIGCQADVPRAGNVTTTWDKSQPLYSLAGALSSGGLTGAFMVVSPISTGSNPDNDSNGKPVKGASPVNTGSAYLNTLEEGWTTSAAAVVDP